MLCEWWASGSGTTGAYMVGYPRVEKFVNRRGIIMCPGGGGTEESWHNGTYFTPNIFTKLMDYLCGDFVYTNRFMTMHTDWTWGNDTMSTRITDTWTTGISKYAFNSSKVHLVGASMGGVVALNWAKANPTKVASLSLIIPAVDLDDIQANPNMAAWGLGGTLPSTAYGGSVPNDHNPAENTASFVGIPGRMWYSNNDGVCRKPTVELFADKAAMPSVNLGDQFPSGFAIPGHAADNIDPKQVADWILSND